MCLHYTYKDRDVKEAHDKAKKDLDKVQAELDEANEKIKELNKRIRLQELKMADDKDKRAKHRE